MDKKLFLEKIKENYAGIKNYVWGADGRNGDCDCIGLMIGAIRRGGGEWKGTHGTNYAVRNEMSSFAPIVDTDALEVGQLVYKHHKKGDPKWALPDSYKNSLDQNDYYHVGIIMSKNPLEIWHCTSVDGGKMIDKKIGAWSHYGSLKKVGEETPIPDGFREMVVTGGALMLRSGAGTEYSVIERIPNTTHVQAMPYDSEWSQVIYRGIKGYSMSRFLYDPIVIPDTHVTLKLDTETAKNLYYALKSALGGAVK